MRAFPKYAALTVACLFAAAACTNADDSPGNAESATSPSVPSPSNTPETPQTPTTPTPTNPASLIDRLLPTGDVVGLNAEWHWQDGVTKETSTDTFGLCAKADLASIGAMEVVERSYFPPDDSDDLAAEQIAEFPDTKTAALAWTVLKSWRDKCGQIAGANPDLEVGSMVAVPVDNGTARQYLLSWTPGGEETGRFEAFGMVLNGTRIAVLRMDSSGQDYNYPAGHQPMVGMVAAAAGWLD